MTSDQPGRTAEVDRAVLLEFAVIAMTWAENPTDWSRGWLVEAARDAAGHTGIPERFETFADWLEQQPTRQNRTGGAR